MAIIRETNLQQGERLRVRLKGPQGQPFEAFWYTVPYVMTLEEVALQLAQGGHAGMLLEIKSRPLTWTFRIGQLAGHPSVTRVHGREMRDQLPLFGQTYADWLATARQFGSIQDGSATRAAFRNGMDPKEFIDSYLGFALEDRPSKRLPRASSQLFGVNYYKHYKDAETILAHAKRLHPEASIVQYDRGFVVRYFENGPFYPAPHDDYAFESLREANPRPRSYGFIVINTRTGKILSSMFKRSEGARDAISAILSTHGTMKSQPGYVQYSDGRWYLPLGVHQVMLYPGETYSPNTYRP